MTFGNKSVQTIFGDHAHAFLTDFTPRQFFSGIFSTVSINFGTFVLQSISRLEETESLKPTSQVSMSYIFAFSSLLARASHGM